MTDTINDVAAEQVPAEPATLVDQQLVERLLAQAKGLGVELVGPDRVLRPVHQAGAGDSTGGRDQ